MLAFNQEIFSENYAEVRRIHAKLEQNKAVGPRQMSEAYERIVNLRHDRENWTWRLFLSEASAKQNKQDKN